MGVYGQSAYPYPWYMPPHYWWPGSPPRVPQPQPALRDRGRTPYVVNIAQAARQNRNFRTALWTGEHFQVTLMSIPVGEDIGLEVHPTTDQFVRIEEGQGLVQMGPSRDRLEFRQMAYPGSAVMIPAGTWHNITNTGNRPLKVYAIYAPPEHPFGTIHPTKPEEE
ncbi:MAG: cupin [Symbiobacterium thermophilum]|uniref:Cupin n=1 Tax=Symbiobacterium thermophilum TaxID=2734 RepID=A0A1Y2T497_SYMTR|nr:MAG: cupin [Symbiobacterium thermophilum]